MIVIDARYIRERPSGIGAMVHAIVQRVPPLMPDVRFLLLRHPLARESLSSAPNVQQVTLRAEANGPATLLVLPRLVDLREARLFHAPFNILPIGLAMPTVVTVHDVLWLSSPVLCRESGPWGYLQTAFFGLGLRHALRHAHRIIAVSRATRDAIATVSPGAAMRCRVIPHGVDGAFTPARTDADWLETDETRQRHAPGARRHVLVVGRSAGYKNQRRAVEAYLQAFRGDSGTHLVLVQRLGSDSREFLDLARAAGAEGRVHVRGAVSLDDLVALYRGALCLCQPSLVEGWGMPVVEAMACGCPVVASETPAIREVTDGAAVFVDPKETTAISEGLQRMGTDCSLRRSLRKTALDRVAQLSWERHAAQTAGLYREMLGGTRQPDARVDHLGSLHVRRRCPGSVGQPLPLGL